MYYEDMVPYKYRKVGGWMMFFNVLFIISIVGGALGILLLALLLSLATSDNALDGYSTLYVLALTIQLIVGMVFAILARKKMQERDKAGYRRYGLLYYGFAIACSVVVPFFNGSVAMGNYFYSIAVSVGWFLFFYFYVAKSERVAVYFDPNYVPPPLPPAVMYYPYGANYYGVNPQASYPYGQYGYGQYPYMQYPYGYSQYQYPPAYGQPPYPGAYQYPPQPQSPYSPWGPPPQA